MSASVFFYVQHLLGVGHLVRASLIAQALVARGAAVTMVTGGRPLAGFPGPGIDVIALPPVSAGPGGFSDLIDGDGNPVGEPYRQARRAALLEGFLARRPDLLLIEAYPFGRRQMRFELEPLLQAAGALSPPPLAVCSVRDILQPRAAERDRRTAETIASAFDLVLVHGDPAFARLEETFPPAADLHDKIVYTGIVSGTPGALLGEAFDVVVSAGGGTVGERLLRTAIAARPLSSLATARWCVITGPHVDARVAGELRAAATVDVTVCPLRSDFRALLRSARLSVSQAGYNTAADILRAGCRSVMVPFSADGETEQTVRAGKLARRGLVGVVAEADLNPQTLATAIDARMDLAPPRCSPPIDLAGAECAARVLIEAVSARKLAN